MGISKNLKGKEKMSQVLALKYRPSTFDKLIGQDSITQTLTAALDQKRLSHAYLFSGLRGSGKTSTARILSKCMVCDQGPTSKPCEVCENCQMANENRHIDIIEMDAASSRKIDDIRALIEQTKYKPNSARFKIFIIDEVHMLTKEAFNALLKTLEEPPEYVKFILATTDPLKLPATILSRTQHFRFKKISKRDIVNHLSHILNLENIEYEQEALEMLSRSGEGSLRDTLTLLDQAIIYSKGFIDAKSVASMIGLLDPQVIDEIFDAILKNNRSKIIEFVQELENYESEIIIDEFIAYLKERFFEEDIRFSSLLTERFFRILSEAKNLLFLNADSGFVLSLVFFKMLEATNIKTIDELINSLEKSTSPIKETKKAIPTPVQKMPKKELVDCATLYQKLLNSLYDRNFEVGECFKTKVEFVSFQNNELSLISCADEKCKKTLRHASSVIKFLVKDIFGFDTKIKMLPCDKKEEELEKELKEKENKANENSSSMMEDIETKDPSSSSCIASDLSQTKELNGKDILNDPFIQKAKELFNPTRIVIKQKV